MHGLDRRYGPPITWRKTLLFCAVFPLFVIIFIYAPILFLVWLLIEGAR